MSDFYFKSLSCALSGLVMVAVIIGSRKVGINPDNVATPIAASLGDLTTLSLLGGVSSLFFCYRGQRSHRTSRKRRESLSVQSPPEMFGRQFNDQRGWNIIQCKTTTAEQQYCVDWGVVQPEEGSMVHTWFHWAAQCVKGPLHRFLHGQNVLCLVNCLYLSQKTTLVFIFYEECYQRFLKDVSSVALQTCGTCLLRCVASSCYLSQRGSLLPVVPHQSERS